MKKLFLLIVFTISFTSCFKKYNTINISIPSFPKTLNSQIANDESSRFLLLHLFEGLTKEDKNGKIVPGVASNWTVSGKIWTFNLNKNAKWHNGINVTANDFVSAWEKIINSNSKNENAHYFYMIKGAYEYSKGQVSNFDSVGIRALNDEVLQVELVENIDYFDKIVAQTIFYPINEKFYNAHKENYGEAVKNVLGNGTYKISKFSENKEIVLVRNILGELDAKNEVEKIIIQINSNDNEKKELYNKGFLDVFDYYANIGEDEKIIQLTEFYTGEMRYIGFGDSKKILSNAKIKKAIALSVDKNEFINSFNGREKHGNTFIPQNVFGNINFKNQNKLNFDTASAKQYLAEGLNELSLTSKDFENVTLLVRANSEEKKRGNFIVNQINKNLGLNIRVVTKTSQMIEQKIGSGSYDMVLNTFRPKSIYDMEYLDFYNSILNNSGNTEYSGIIKKVYKEMDDKKKKELLENAENILLKEIPIIPISFFENSYVIKKNVKNIRLSNLTGELDFRYATIEK